MSQKSPGNQLATTVLRHLAHPLKLRLALCTTLLTAWYLLLFSPMSERLAATTSKIAVERQRVVTAREIDRLKKSLAPLRDAVAPVDVSDLMRHVIQHVGSSSLKLNDLRPEPLKDAGAYDVIGLKVGLEGGFSDLDEFLRWIEAEKRLLRVDSITITPNRRDTGRLSAQLTLVTLSEKPIQAAKPKGEPEKKP